MKVLFLIIAVGFFSYIVFSTFSHTEGILRRYFSIALVFKIIAGVVFGLVYQYHYEGGDTIFFFQGASQSYEVFYTNPLKFFQSFSEGSLSGITDRRSGFFVGIISLLNLFSLNNYWVLTVFLSFISFATAWLLIGRLIRSYGINPLAALIAFIFFPTVAFWTSGIIKEAVSFSAMSLIVLATIPVIKGERVKLPEMVFGLVGLWILIQLKYYHAAVLILVLLPLMVWRPLAKRVQNAGLRIGLLFSIGLLSLFLASMLHHNLGLSRVFQVVVENNQAFNYISDEHEVIHYYELQPGWGSLLINSPVALFSALFKPLPWDSWNIESLIGSLENFVLLICVATAIYRIRHLLFKQQKETYAIIFYVTVMAIALGLSTPNYGTLSRYKVAFLPFLVLIVSNSLLKSKWPKRFVGMDNGS